MRNQFLSTTLLLAFILLAACSKKDDPPPSDSNIIPAQNLADAQQIASRAVAHCTYPDQCSPSVGLLIGTTASFAYQCTAFLVADNIVATNSHCVPEDLKKAGTSCANRIALVFPSTEKFSGVKTGCAQVLSASDIDSKLIGPDFAFLELDTELSRPSLPITRTGLSDNTTYNVYKMDPYQGNGIPEGYLHKAQCKSVYGSLITGGNASPLSDVQTLADCSVIHGNSGSPVIDSSGNVPAIVFATIDHDKIGELLTEIARHGINFIDTAVADMGIATNYACQTVPTNQSAVPSECGKYIGSQSFSSDASIKAAISSNLNNSILAKLRAGSSRLDPSLSWKSALINGKGINSIGAIGDVSDSMIAMSVPSCVIDKDKFLEPEQKNWSGGYANTSDRQVSLLLWTIKSGLNRYLQIESRLTEATTDLEQSMFLKFNPNQLASQNMSNADIESGWGDYQNTPLISESLSDCSE